MASIEVPTSSSQREKPDHRPYHLTKQSKRLTLNFPILPLTSQPDRQSSPLDHTIPADSLRPSPRLPTITASPTESSTFLTSLAAQERHVLELREELHRAEADLLLLKKQWARHEAGRQKNELQHVERLQPLPNIYPGEMISHNENGFTPATALRASLESGTDRPVVRKSTQRVFSGSRHTRALSLLSPSATSKQSGQSSPFEEALSPTVTTTDIHSKQQYLSRSSTTFSEQDMGFGRTYKLLAEGRLVRPPAKDVIVNSGKKMASDLREGLWTFFEDIRQATVGEEGINGIETRTARVGSQQRQGQRRTQEREQVRSKAKEETTGETEKERVSDILRRSTATPTPGPKDRSFWNEFGLETPSNEDTHNISGDEQPMSEAKVSLVELDARWDIWDSPLVQQSPKHGAIAGENPRPGDELPWPELMELTPSRLSRKVSDLMKEWESPAVTSQKSPAGLDDQAVASPHI